MNSSAKVIVISLLAAWALGVGVMSACTVTSGTVNDTDGGTPVTTPPPGDTTDPDSGAPVVAATCPSNTNQDAGDPIRSAGCQACLNAKCCTQLTNCFGIQATVTCGDYYHCIDNCGPDPNAEACENCRIATEDSGVVEAYDAVGDCADGPDGGDPANACAAECQ